METSATATIMNDKATIIAAWLGALGTIGLTVLEVTKYLRDKARIEIKYGFNLELIGTTVGGRLVNTTPDKTLWSITVNNRGNKNFIFNQLSFSHTNTDRHTILTKDYDGEITKLTILPGDGHSFTIANDLVNPEYVKEIVITDATGKSFRKRVSHKV